MCACNDPEHYHPMPSPREQELAFAQEMVDAAGRALAHAKAELKRVRQETYPEEPHQTVIEFSIRFVRNGRTYRYAAIKINDERGGPASWFLTGQDSNYTWKQLVTWIEQKHIIVMPFVVMTGEPIRGFYGQQ